MEFFLLADMTCKIQPTAITVCSCGCLSVNECVPLCIEQFLMHIYHMWHIYAHTFSRYAYQVFDIYAQFGGHFCILHIFDNYS